MLSISAVPGPMVRVGDTGRTKTQLLLIRGSA